MGTKTVQNHRREKKGDKGRGDEDVLKGIEERKGEKQNRVY